MNNYSLAYLIHKLDRLVVKKLDERLRGFDVSTNQWFIVEAVGSGLSKPSDIAQASGLDKATVTGLIKRLSKAGVIERTLTVTDLRSVRIKLTNKGKAVHQRLKGIVSDFQASELAGLDKSALELFIENMLK